MFDSCIWLNFAIEWVVYVLHIWEFKFQILDQRLAALTEGCYLPQSLQECVEVVCQIGP